jgi:adenylate kinase
LREEVAKKTSLGKEIAKYMEKGDLVPNQFVVDIVRLELAGSQHFILDGFPRDVNQAKAIEDFKLNTVIFLDVSEKIVVERLSERRICPKCGASFHLKYVPPKKTGFCDHCDTKLIQRKDDNPTVIKERFKVYQQNTKPVIAYYLRKKILQTVDASLNPEEVYKKVKKLIK